MTLHPPPAPLPHDAHLRSSGEFCYVVWAAGSPKLSGAAVAFPLQLWWVCRRSVGWRSDQHLDRRVGGAPAAAALLWHFGARRSRPKLPRAERRREKFGGRTRNRRLCKSLERKIKPRVSFWWVNESVWESKETPKLLWTVGVKK